MAKYIATSTYEASLDVKSMSNSSTKVFLLEVMGRHAGWIAAAAGVLKSSANAFPHIILFPERVFNEKAFLKKVSDSVEKDSYCVVVTSEGIKYSNNEFVSAGTSRDSFGHAHLGGVAPKLSQMIQSKLKLKVHWAVSDYLQRASRHIGSSVDVKQAYEIGKKSINYAKNGITDVMVTIKKGKTKTYGWEIGYTNLKNVANKEKVMPNSFISKDGFGITNPCKKYILNLIKGCLLYTSDAADD